MQFDWSRRDDPEYRWQYDQYRKKEERKTKIIALTVVGIASFAIFAFVSWLTTPTPGSADWFRDLAKKSTDHAMSACMAKYNKLEFSKASPLIDSCTKEKIQEAI